MADHDELCKFATDWIAALQSGDYGVLRSISIVVENTDGQIASINQATGYTDRLRLVGALTDVAHRIMDGGGKIEDLRR